jgi:hypothetical protein
MMSILEELPCSASPLKQVLMHRFPDQFAVYADLFAMGCLLHFQGERGVAYSLINQVLNTVDHQSGARSQHALLAELTGNEMRFAQEMQPSPEIQELWCRAVRAPLREAACAR